MKLRLTFLASIFLITSIFSEEMDIEQKVKQLSEDTSVLKQDLKRKYQEFQDLYLKNPNENEYPDKLKEINEIKKKILDKQLEFKNSSIQDGMKTDEGYAFWDQGETTVSQIIMEYGSQDYLYVIPNELGSMKLSLHSTIPIPKDSWDEMIKLIMNQNGIGIKKINPYLAQLYVLKHDPGNIEGIVQSQVDLDFMDDGSYLAYIFYPKAEQIKSVHSFFERFSDIKHTSVHSFGSSVVVVSSKETLVRLTDLYKKVFENSEGKIIKVISLNKISAEDGEKILKAFFLENPVKTRPSFFQSTEEMSVIAQGTSLVLIGDQNIVKRATMVVEDLESQLQDPSEMSIFWYCCKHSNPDDLAQILEKLYSSMNNANLIEKEKKNFLETNSSKEKNQLVVSPKVVQPGVISDKKEIRDLKNNFVVDSKTNSILMVVKKDDLNNLKGLLEKLDIPKKMVQIDILLVERKIQDKKQSGMNLLKIGSGSGNKETSIGFDGFTSKKKGLFDFLISRPASKLPSFDIALSFLMAQEEMKIADCPTILTVNQTPATISVVDEISLNNGVIQIDATNGGKLEKSFSRAQFGTTIVITPTIHENENNEEGFVTLHTDVSFDTTKSSSENDRPNVTRRKIENEVRVADGETIILGGLRRKTNEHGSEKIPFLGEIPGIGKLFGASKSNDTASEMFVFITPHIIKNQSKNLSEAKLDLLKRRPGDTDEFLNKLEFAKKNEKLRLFENSMKLIFD